MNPQSLMQTVTLVASLSTAAVAEPLTLWYDQPATRWEQEALPIGNGRLGAMLFGGISKERIQFNEESLWIGDEQDTGAYQPFGDLFLEFDHPGATGYRRELDLTRAMHTVTYTSGGIHFRREYFASHPAHVIVLRFTADQPGAYTGSIQLTDAHHAPTIAAGQTLTCSGTLAGYSPQDLEGWANSSADKTRKYSVELSYEAQAQLVVEGGTVVVRDGKLRIEKASAFTVFLSAGTDFVQDASKGWRGGDPHGANLARLAKAASMPYEALVAQHVNDYQALFGRVLLNLGTNAAVRKDLPTDQRLAAYRVPEPYVHLGQPSPDPELEALQFQYARYLMIASSRKGDLPANLQGIWNEKRVPEWRCDYHTDVNVQMNYWFVDVANLPGCFEPLAEWLHSVIPIKREATAKRLKIRGWGLTSENGLFGGSSYHFVPGDAAWVAQNIWDHYAFTQDKQYLETRAYPVLKELCEFWEDYLKETPDGKLVSPASISPEHGPSREGNAYEQQLVFDLFTNTIEASQILGKDAEFRERIAAMRDRLLGPAVGSWGQLLEWSSELNRPEFRFDPRAQQTVEKSIARLREESAKDPHTAAGIVWAGFTDAARTSIEAGDLAAFAEGLNAVVNGKPLNEEPAFAKSAPEYLGFLLERGPKTAEFQKWINWSLLVTALHLEGLVHREDTPLDTHRHTSHLIAVYPGRQITPAATPDFARAAAISLAARGEAGDSRREWAWVWRAAIWARLAEPERAYRCIAGLFTFSVVPNLLQTHPPFQIDGSFGYAAAVAEMLLQSHETDEQGRPVIHLLPALPKAWPEGSFQGLCARGGFAVDATWKNGVVTSYRITASEPREVKLRIGDAAAKVVRAEVP